MNLYISLKKNQENQDLGVDLNTKLYIIIHIITGNTFRKIKSFSLINSSGTLPSNSLS